MLRKIFIGLVVLTGLLYYIYSDFTSRTNAIKSVKADFKISTLSIPELNTKLTQENGLSDYSIWDLDLKKLEKEGVVKREGKVFYKYEVKKFGKNEAIVRVGETDSKNRWELHGIVKKNSKTMVVFYNPSNKKVKLLSKGEVIEDSLIIEEINPNQIVVKYPKNENEYETLELKVFYVDVETYKKKKKEVSDETQN